MKKKTIALICAVTAAAFAMSGCKKKEEPEAPGPVEQTLTAVTINDLQAGSYYVKNGSEFYLLPAEGLNFDTSRQAQSTQNTPNGMMDQTKNRIVDFVYKDSAIPTLYKSDQLVFKSKGNVPSFTWERFLDQGYSIGLYGLQPTSAGKVQFTNGVSGVDQTSSINNAVAAKVAEGLDIGNGFVVDKINGTSITKDNIRDGGIIAGLTKDAIASCDLYIGTTLASVEATADTRVFTSYELFTTDMYSNSPDGYAIVDIPDYLKSGYYWINNAGMVKYYDVERGSDTTNIKLEEPYYYKGDNNEILTFYEYQEKNGTSQTDRVIEGGAASLSPTADVINFNTDVTQTGLNFTVAYKYHSEADEMATKQTGKFPKIVLVSPTGTATELAAGKAGTNGDEKGWMFVNSTIEGAVAGTWQLRFYNFENIYRTITTDISSGNAKTFIQNGSSGRINIHFEASPNANDITITWQNKDRAADVEIVTPDHVTYSKEETPGNVMLDEYGKVVFKLPNLIDGSYTFSVKGSELGRVWIDNQESVSIDPSAPEETTPGEEPTSEGETTTQESESAAE